MSDKIDPKGPHKLRGSTAARPCTTVEQIATASDHADDGARITGGREGAPLAVVRQDGYLHGRLVDAVVGVDASERVQPVDATYGGTRGQAVLHREEALVAVGVEVLGRADLLVLHDAVGLEETVARVLVAGLALGSG
jgi:hypothetical protein